jgi:hypothetical protein
VRLGAIARFGVAHASEECSLETAHWSQATTAPLELRAAALDERLEIGAGGERAVLEAGVAV